MCELIYKSIYSRSIIDFMHFFFCRSYMWTYLYMMNLITVDLYISISAFLHLYVPLSVHMCVLQVWNSIFKICLFHAKKNIMHGKPGTPQTPCPASRAVYKRLSTTSERPNSHPWKRTPGKNCSPKNLFFRFNVGSECDTQFYSFYCLDFALSVCSLFGNRL